MTRMRHAVRLLGDLALAGARTGRWWVPLLVPVLGLAALAVVAAHAVVPTVVYVIF